MNDKLKTSQAYMLTDTKITNFFFKQCMEDATFENKVSFKTSWQMKYMVIDGVVTNEKIETR